MRLFFKEFSSVCCLSWIWSLSMALAASSFSALSFSIFCSDSRLRVAKVSWSSATFSDKSQAWKQERDVRLGGKYLIACWVNIWAGNSQNEIVYRFIIQEINWYFERFYSWDIHKFYWCIHGNLICTGRDAISPKRYEREELFSDCNFSWSHWQGYRAGSHCHHCIVTRCFKEDNYSQFSNMERDSQASPRVTHLYIISVSLVFAKD